MYQGHSVLAYEVSRRNVGNRGARCPAAAGAIAGLRRMSLYGW